MTENQERVEDAIDDLPTCEQTIIRMTYYLGYTQTQIAIAIGCCRQTVATRTQSALRTLRRELSE
jgi:RNA polymerase sigma factor (sigma-70 family)